MNFGDLQHLTIWPVLSKLLKFCAEVFIVLLIISSYQLKYTVVLKWLIWISPFCLVSSFEICTDLSKMNGLEFCSLCIFSLLSVSLFYIKKISFLL